MRNKIEKVKTINEAIQKSNVAKKYEMKAELRNNKIVYTQTRITAMGTTTRIRIVFKDILFTLQREDVLNLHKLYGKKIYS